MKHATLALLSLLSWVAAHAADPPPPAPSRVAGGVWLLPGSFLPGRQPDGNTVVFEGASGFIVMDTGRHRSHTQAILDFAASRRRPITAIVNSHWHLDHTSGDAAIRAAYPGVRLYATTAIERAIREFWPKGTKEAQAYLATVDPKSGLAEDIRSDIHAQTHPDPMRPDVPVTASGAQEIDGVRLQFGVAANAATDADLWVFDPRSKVLASGDLVTFPVPFLDTACVAGWQRGLEAIDEMPFRVLVPGHGKPMDRAQFSRYKAAFAQFTGCAASPADKATCAADWAKATESLREAGDDERTRAMAGYYVSMLRENGGNSARCAAK
jgi:glyoxylase-like metal-dependent hydrolase (beta-lactamase superfamily II)